MADVQSTSPEPYLREMRPEERHVATVVCTRSFATNPIQRWIGNVPRGSSIPPPPRSVTLKGLSALHRDTRTLYWFQNGLLRTTLLTGGRVLVIVQPKDGSDGDEEILAVALWNRPGADIDSFNVILRSKMYRAVVGDAKHPLSAWGIAGLRRALGAQATRTDPDEEGKGYAGKLMREGFAFIGNKPCVLEVPSGPRVKKITSTTVSLKRRS
ncbi:hypothetical protein EXIGLDRAFT_721756 [Exidia glandulosa HHB12029]|uniref:N-acetyltransferase domain-containing protein n=1 Tax=Exidia glandulosa HHB12029 TaxID=1314781 RepID=A0A165QFP2_EXIGL|nr:hypothetical protein EXIGLDRAFT_721756 [Exidia glandulosa HHB12029]